MSANKVRSLDKLGIGKDAIIEAIECDDKALRSHILDMGLTPGVEVTLVKTAPMGDPLEIRVRGYELTLRKSDASKIIISDIHDAHNCPRKNPISQDVQRILQHLLRVQQVHLSLDFSKQK